MTDCPDCGYQHCHTRDWLAVSAYCPRCSSSFPIANAFVEQLVQPQAKGYANADQITEGRGEPPQ